MAEIELVIKIDEEIYNDFKSLPFTTFTEDIIKNGIPLPKGHGDLIDKSKIHKSIPAEEDNCTGMGMSYDEMDAYNDGIDAMYSLVENAKPIIEKDETVRLIAERKENSL